MSSLRKEHEEVKKDIAAVVEQLLLCDEADRPALKLREQALRKKDVVWLRLAEQEAQMRLRLAEQEAQMRLRLRNLKQEMQTRLLEQEAQMKLRLQEQEAEMKQRREQSGSRTGEASRGAGAGGGDIERQHDQGTPAAPSPCTAPWWRSWLPVAAVLSSFWNEASLLPQHVGNKAVEAHIVPLVAGQGLHPQLPEHTAIVSGPTPMPTSPPPPTEQLPACRQRRSHRTAPQ